MPRPLEDRVTVEASPAALVICFLVGRGPFQDAMAEPGKQPLEQSGRRTGCDAEERAAEARDDRLRQPAVGRRSGGRIHILSDCCFAEGFSGNLQVFPRSPFWIPLNLQVLQSAPMKRRSFLQATGSTLALEILVGHRARLNARGPSPRLDALRHYSNTKYGVSELR